MKASDRSGVAIEAALIAGLAQRCAQLKGTLFWCFDEWQGEAQQLGSAFAFAGQKASAAPISATESIAAIAAFNAFIGVI